VKREQAQGKPDGWGTRSAFTRLEVGC
jgi:hypothetical protein